MGKIIKALFSMRMMALGMLVFLVAIGIATMIESTYDIQAAKIMIYNALWFEILLVYLVLNLIANIYTHRMFQRSKIAMLVFHLSFIIIIIGAGITRHFSFEGLMLIREGESTDLLYASEPHVWYRIDDEKGLVATGSKKKYMSEQTNNYFSIKENVKGRKSPIKIEYVDFHKRQIDSVMMNDTIKSSVLEIVMGGMTSSYVGQNDYIMLGGTPLSFNKSDGLPGIAVTKVNGKLMVKSVVPMRYLPMTEMTKFRQAGLTPPDSLYKQVPTDSLVPFLATTLYQVNEEQFVFRSEIQNAKKAKMSSGKKDVGADVLTIKITDGDQTMLYDLEGGMGQIPSHHKFIFNGLTYQMEYGSTLFQLPFKVQCNDFQLDTYPGSDVASSFASEVTILDPANNYKRHQRIFMNNVMDYNGFRFFQSAYDLDDPATPENEEGTRLSVNQDWWGTNVTYLGYLLMGIGMFLSIFAPVGRFQDVLGKIKKSRQRRESSLMILILVSLSLTFGTTNAYAQVDPHAGHNHAPGEGHDHEDHTGHNHAPGEGHGQADQHSQEIVDMHTKPEKPIYRVISEKHSEELATLLVQDFRGRIIPFHTMCNELLIKISGENTYQGKNAVQVVMSMHMYPDYWVTQKVINVPKAVQERLKIGATVSYMDLTNLKTGDNKYLAEYNASHQKLESKRDEFEKKIIKLVEKYQVLQAFMSWGYMKLIPMPNDPSQMWHVPLEDELMKVDTTASMMTLRYLASLDEGARNNNFAKASTLLSSLKAFQRSVSNEDILPTEKHVDVEISYNKMHIFKNAMNSYLLIGFVLLILFFVRIFIKPTAKSERLFKRLSIPFIVAMVITFIYHGLGLLARSYISGHAPWSDGYEAVIFIAWVTMLAGFVFSRKNPVVLAGTAVLAFFMIFVTELNLLDPEISPLQPVLKSYWLMIHVAVITGSYGFLGLGAILGLLNKILYIFRTKLNGKRITAHIHEISYISEMTMTIGLFMLTIGTFLGGIWANESWGRYWGWDPKETWALVSVLVYAVLLHLRFIPKLSDKFTFNLVSFWSYAAILFTFFGVNFYLVGLHSYAQGEGLGVVPDWIFWACFGFYVLSEIAAVQFQLYKQDASKVNLKHFIRKAIITSGILYIVAILQMWLIERRFDADALLSYTKIVGLVLIVIAAMFAFATLRVKNENIPNKADLN
ncbi:MAG: cytochrome c biogenesis protein CcsA [Crocinitomicaceae bacterium]|nr:cytochrome c biogenesis protein CcsA [Crocinitomicaceae bacterium]